jgi:hypothetical protein
MSNTGDKFQVVTDPFLVPQKCAACNTQKMGLYIDFGLQIKRYGRVYFCKECFMEANQALHMTVPVSSHLEEIEKLKEENANLNYLLTVDLRGLQSYLDSVLSKSEDAEQVEQPIIGQTKRGPGRPKRTE